VGVSDILKQHRLNFTSIREEIIRILSESNLALSMSEIKERLMVDCNRVTLYRNLKTFTDKKIVHQIFVDNLVSKYMIPDNVLQPDQTESNHLHFRCMRCNNVKCLKDHRINPVRLPDGYVMLDVNYVVFGLCDVCSEN